MAKKVRTKAEWSELLNHQRASGQGVKEWCVANGVNVNSMYNRIAKNHKTQGNNGCEFTGETIKSNKTITTAAKQPATVEWKEIKPFPQQQEALQRSSIYVEIGGMRLAADAGYPVTKLAALCKELIRP